MSSTNSQAPNCLGVTRQLGTKKFVPRANDNYKHTLISPAPDRLSVGMMASSPFMISLIYVCPPKKVPEPKDKLDVRVSPWLVGIITDLGIRIPPFPRCFSYFTIIDSRRSNQFFPTSLLPLLCLSHFSNSFLKDTEKKISLTPPRPSHY